LIFLRNKISPSPLLSCIIYKLKKFFEGYLKEFVYGALDGTVTTFAIIAGSAGASLSSAIVLILGFSNVLADGFSMASSNYLAEKSSREQSGEISETKTGPFKKALATFVSFILIGTIPLFPYLLNAITGIWQENTFLISGIFTSIAFLLVGQIRGKITKKNKIISGLETLIIGGIAASVAYAVGAFLDKIV